MLLYALRADGSGIRAYTVSEIDSVRVTTQPFLPKFLVEFRPTGGLHAAPVSSGPRSFRRSPDRPYRVECPVCGKTFTRSRPGTQLNAHKDRYGYRCSARQGYEV